MRNIKDFDTFVYENKQINNKQYHYFYKIENQINKHFYYGIHSTYNIDDGYMGSGVGLHEAYDEFGIENFKKIILKYFNTRKELLEYEKKIVNNILVKDKSCYNRTIGGSGHPHTNELVTVTDGKKNFVVSIDDERYKSGELKGVTIGRAHYIDEDGNVICITPEEAKKRGLKGHTTGKIPARKIGSNEKYKLIPINDFDTSIYETPTTGKVTVKDSEGNFYNISISDERYKSGELKPIWFGKKHTEETKTKMSNTHKSNSDQVGEKNSQYGTTWLTNPKLGKEEKFKLNDIIKKFEEGWIPGRLNANWYKKYLETGELPMRFKNLRSTLTLPQKMYNKWKSSI